MSERNLSKHTELLGVKVRSSRNCNSPLAAAWGYRITKSHAYSRSDFSLSNASDQPCYSTITEQARQVPASRTSVTYADLRSSLLIQWKHLRMYDHPSLILHLSSSRGHSRETEISSFRGETALRGLTFHAALANHILAIIYFTHRLYLQWEMHRGPRTIMRKRRKDKSPSSKAYIKKKKKKKRSDIEQAYFPRE